MKTAKEKMWICVSCGSKNDYFTNCFGDASPKEGDLTICIECGTVYQRRDGWRLMGIREIDQLPDDVKKDLAKLEAARQLSEIKSEKRKKNDGYG